MRPGSVFEIKDWELVDTVYGKGINLSIVETKATLKGVNRVPSKIMISDRFEPECEKVPCVGYYAGTKPTKSGNSCHDLRFIKHDDESGIFHESDDESDESRLPPPTITFYTPGICGVCEMPTEECRGYCEKCNDHLPTTGGQHMCVLDL